MANVYDEKCILLNRGDEDNLKSPLFKDVVTYKAKQSLSADGDKIIYCQMNGTRGNVWMRVEQTNSTPTTIDAIDFFFSSATKDTSDEIQLGAEGFVDMKTGGTQFDFTSVDTYECDITKWVEQNGNFETYLGPNGFLIKIDDNAGGNITGDFNFYFYQGRN